MVSSISRIPGRRSQPEDSPIECSPLVLGSRQVAVVAFVIIALISLVATVSYFAGRIASTPGSLQDNTWNATSPQPEQFIVVDPPIPAVPAQLRLPRNSPLASHDHPLFFQVAATANRGGAELAAESLRRKSLPVRVAPSATEDVYRVLVGPITGPEESTRLRGILKRAGFRPFLKRLSD